jgi:hypothetical protein
MDGDIVFGKLSVGGGPTKKKGAVDVKSQLKKIETQQQKLDKIRAEDKDKVRLPFFFFFVEGHLLPRDAHFFF